jgi:hypothetical protein
MAQPNVWLTGKQVEPAIEYGTVRLNACVGARMFAS